MSQSRKKIRRRLEQALENPDPVVVIRKHLDEGWHLGHVIAHLDDWVVLHSFDRPILDGLVCLRLNEVTKAQRVTSKELAYLRRANPGGDGRIGEFSIRSSASVRDLLIEVDRRALLIGLHIETSDGDWINFGRVRRLGNKRVDLQFIGRDGVLVDYTDAWKLSEITRIELGGRYIQALEQFGEPMPSVKRRVKR